MRKNAHDSFVLTSNYRNLSRKPLANNNNRTPRTNHTQPAEIPKLETTPAPQQPTAPNKQALRLGVIRSPLVQCCNARLKPWVGK